MEVDIPDSHVPLELWDCRRSPMAEKECMDHCAWIWEALDGLGARGIDRTNWISIDLSFFLEKSLNNWSIQSILWWTDLLLE